MTPQLKEISHINRELLLTTIHLLELSAKYESFRSILDGKKVPTEAEVVDLTATLLDIEKVKGRLDALYWMLGIEPEMPSSVPVGTAVKG